MQIQPAKPRGPRGAPLVGSLPAALKDALALWLDLTLNYGPVSYARVAWFDLYMLSEPELVSQLLVTHHRVCVKDQSGLPELLEFSGLGLMSLEGDAWRTRRKLVAPSLSPKRLDTYADAVVELSARTATELADGARRDFHQDSMRLALAIAAKTLLGVDVGPDADRIGEIMEYTLSYFTKRMFRVSQRLIPKALPTRDQRTFRAAVRDLDAIVYRMLARCRAQATTEKHLLAELLRARDEHGQALTDRELRDEVVTMLVAGHETSALTLTYAVYELSRHPADLQQLRAEVERAAPMRALRYEDLAQLVWTEAVVKETLRLYPPGHALSRRVLEPVTFAGFTLPVGSLVGVSPYAMHRNPRFFPEPQTFRPQRWLNATELPRGCYLPFGDGPRVCVGNHFALAELKLMLGTLLRAVDVTVAPDYQMQLVAGITLRPDGGLPVTVRRRSAERRAGLCQQA